LCVKVIMVAVLLYPFRLLTWNGGSINRNGLV